MMHINTALLTALCMMVAIIPLHALSPEQELTAQDEITVTQDNEEDLQPIPLTAFDPSAAINQQISDNEDETDLWYDDNDMANIDPLPTTAVYRHIAVEGVPSNLTLAPDNITVYVGSVSERTITPINSATNTVGTPVHLQCSPFALAIQPNGKSAYILDVDDQTISLINITTGALEAEPIRLDFEPAHLIIPPYGTHAYVINKETNAVEVISLTTGNEHFVEAQ